MVKEFKIEKFLVAQRWEWLHKGIEFLRTRAEALILKMSMVVNQVTAVRCRIGQPVMFMQVRLYTVIDREIARDNVWVKELIQYLINDWNVKYDDHENEYILRVMTLYFWMEKEKREQK